MKMLFHKSLALALAVMTVLSTVSWTVDKHLCMGRVMDVALFGKADDCGMGQANYEMAGYSAQKSCCGDESTTIVGQDTLRTTTNDHEDATFISIHHPSAQFILPVSGVPQINTVPIAWREPPPLAGKRMLLFHQVFLI